MGTSQAEKLESHDRIVRIAARKFREAGLEGISVADLMKEAGLTHGGFYRHFDSREALVAEAVECALAQSDVARLANAPGKAPITSVLDSYLSRTHRDQPGEGCAVAGFAGDVTRADARTRSAYTRQANDNITALARVIDAGGDADARKKAIVLVTAMIGALTLARAVDDEALSLEILGTARAALKDFVKAS